MSTVRYAVRVGDLWVNIGHGLSPKPHRFLGPTRKQAKAYVRRLAVIGEDGNAVVVRVVQYSPAETAARRAVIEAAERMAMRGARGDLIALIRAVGDLRAAERKEAGNG